VYRPNCRNCPPVNFQLTSPPPASCHLVSSGHTLHCPPLFGWKVPNTHPFKVINHLSMMLGNSHMLSTDHRTLRRWSPNGCQMVTRSSPNGHLAVTNFQKLLDSASSIKKCLVEILKLMLDRFSEDEIWSRFLLNLIRPKKLLWQAKLNPRVCCAFGNVTNCNHWALLVLLLIRSSCWYQLTSSYHLHQPESHNSHLETAVVWVCFSRGFHNKMAHCMCRSD